MRIQIIVLLLLSFLAGTSQKIIRTDVLVIGGGTGGTAAGIQSARLETETIIVESTRWLGGMISSAGVSAIDGNHLLPSGLWAEFRQELYKVYGGPAAVETGWVSNTLFEPHVADSIFKAMASKEKKLKVYFNYSFHSLMVSNHKITGVKFSDKKTGEQLIVKAKIYIDATELGDVIKAAGAGYDLGMESGAVTGEKAGVIHSNNIVQDLTYIAILKNYGEGTDKTIPKPLHYGPSEFDGACTDYYKNKKRKAPAVDAKTMLDYGRLPNGKYMLNWPLYGNDTYLNIVEMSETERQKELAKAKEATLRFVYFIQHELGFKNLGLANEFPTKDKLAIIPYYREGRRVKGLVRLTMSNISEPFNYGDPLYRTGISVGDYPIDHHHKKNTEAPQHLDFYPIPSFNIPLGALIPQNFDNLIAAEKGISVSNVVNGTTRLQPCVLLTGQAAGTLASLCSKKNIKPAEIPVRTVQQSLLYAKAYIMPYIDVTTLDKHFEAVQKIGATGILKGTGIPDKWENQTWFYPDSLIDAQSLSKGLNDFQKGNYNFRSDTITTKDAIAILLHFKPFFADKHKMQKMPTSNSMQEYLEDHWQQWGFTNFDLNRRLTRLELAVILDEGIDPFSMKGVDYKGYFIR